MTLSKQAKAIAANHFLSHYVRDSAEDAYDAMMDSGNTPDDILVWHPFEGHDHEQVCDLMEKLAEDVQQSLDEAAQALTRCLTLISDMMPGLRHIALQDYALLNDAPLEAHAVLNKIRRL